MDPQEKLSSLNQMLKWSVEEATKDGRTASSVDPDFVKKNKEVMDAMFADEYGAIEELRKKVEMGEVDVEECVDALENLEEYAQDMNYAENFGKVRVLRTVMELLGKAPEDERVRANAVWLLGTCMQDLVRIKEEVLGLDGVRVLKAALSDPSPKVRAKAVMASSAMLRNFPPAEEPFRASGTLDELVRLVGDEDERPKKRAMFFLEHSHSTGCGYFAEAVANDTELVRSLVSQATEHGDEDAVRAISNGLVSFARGRTVLRDLQADEAFAQAARTSTDVELKKTLLTTMVELRKLQ